MNEKTDITIDELIKRISEATHRSYGDPDSQNKNTCVNVKALIRGDDEGKYLHLCKDKYSDDYYLFLKQCYELFDQCKNPSTKTPTFFGSTLHHKERDSALMVIKRICETFIIPAEDYWAQNNGKMTLNLVGHLALQNKLILLYQQENPNVTEFREALNSVVTYIQQQLECSTLDWLEPHTVRVQTVNIAPVEADSSHCCCVIF